MHDRERDGTGLSKPVRRGDGKEYRSIKEAAEANNIDPENIGKVCRRYVTPDGYPHLTSAGHTWNFI